MEKVKSYFFKNGKSVYKNIDYMNCNLEISRVRKYVLGIIENETLYFFKRTILSKKNNR